MEHPDDIIVEILKSLFEKYKNESWILNSKEVYNEIENSKPGFFKDGTIWFRYYDQKGRWKNIFNQNNIIFGIREGIIFTKSKCYIPIKDKIFSIETPYFKINSTDWNPIYFLNNNFPKKDDNSNDNLISFRDEFLNSHVTDKFSEPVMDLIYEFKDKFDLEVKNFENKKRKNEKDYLIENLTEYEFKIKDEEIYNIKIRIKDGVFLINQNNDRILKFFEDDNTRLYHYEWESKWGINRLDIRKISSLKIEEKGINLRLYDENNPNLWSDILFFKEEKNKILSFLKNVDHILKSNLSVEEFIELSKVKQKVEKDEVKKKVNSLLNEEFDKDNNGELDILQGDNLLMDILEKNETEITQFDHSLVQNIIRLNKFLNTKKKNLVNIFNLLKIVEQDLELNEILSVLRQGIDNYQSLLIHSINMVISLKEKQMITYYELYETFDSLGVFNSNWENEVFGKLSSIDSKLSDVISSIKKVVLSIRNMEDSITSSLDQLTYTTKSSFEQLNTSVTTELKSIRSGIEWNNLLTGIQTYQTYKLRKGK